MFTKSFPEPAVLAAYEALFKSTDDEDLAKLVHVDGVTEKVQVCTAIGACWCVSPQLTREANLQMCAKRFRCDLLLRLSWACRVH